MDTTPWRVWVPGSSVMKAVGNDVGLMAAVGRRTAHRTEDEWIRAMWGPELAARLGKQIIQEGGGVRLLEGPPKTF